MIFCSNIKGKELNRFYKPNYKLYGTKLELYLAEELYKLFITPFAS